MTRLSLYLLLLLALPGSAVAEKLSRKESRCVSRCDMARYQCSQTATEADFCARGRDACMDRCMGRGYDEQREKRRQELEERRLETGEPD